MVSRAKRASLKGLGARFGATVRKRYSQIYFQSKRRRSCPQCGKPSFKRLAFGVWSCRRCGYSLAGGAHEP